MPKQTSPGPSSGPSRPDQTLPGEQLAEGLRSPVALLVKRVLDIVVALLLLLPAIPFSALIAVAILLESRGPVLFAHSRIGKGNRRFRLWKFRTMVKDAGAVLDQYLEAHPDLLAEWLETHKLKNDPRVTRVGRFLRSSSLDELPQLVSVLAGRMSMVGPRPIVEEEIPKYGPVFDLYVRVKPGLTGLWQVSGRTDTSYRARTALDRRYLRERTLGLDLWVVWKTIHVVLRGHGAY